ncbi:non-canonical purine NTP pyrophosphatase [Actinosynnema sp. ALI-1.44]|uniref:non-canonical purine NTP pyrophosphatase n=1 Tax=Actinosynnema sp. ALI-1.44 TaxID=1933779 RepID=UPI00097C6908|nr:non-canonical purine NTP pyrophosphatase [Actinosynnema sp. ALI-1.44]ONI75254.1 non-canonical purine NTP pyrophosphatase [Actinosynnema sp. ALI-1.44]
MHPIRFASGNAIKLEEARHVFPDVEQLRIDVPEIQATEPAIVVAHKLDAIASLGVTGTVVVEDTGLHIEAWAGLPGALVKWFVEEMGTARLASAALAPTGSSTAEAVSAVGVLHRGETAVWEGRLKGTIVAPRGDLGGWTPIFEVDGSDKTLAELTFTERMAVTMRRGPFESAKAWLADRGTE